MITIVWNEINKMYHIKIHESENHTITAEYTIGGDLIIFRRHSHTNDESVDIGLTVNELLDFAEKIKIRQEESAAGIDPPESECGANVCGYSWKQ